MLRSRILAVPLVVVLALSLAGCGSVVERVRDVVHRATSGDDAPPPNTDIANLKAGDCFLLPDDDASTAVDRVSCTKDHDDEVTAVIEIPGDDFPGDLRVDKRGQIDCRDALVAYVGRDFASSSLDYWYFTPDSTSWNKGQHSVVCYGYSWDNDQLDKSIKGSRL